MNPLTFIIQNAQVLVRRGLPPQLAGSVLIAAVSCWSSGWILLVPEDSRKSFADVLLSSDPCRWAGAGVLPGLQRPSRSAQASSCCPPLQR